MPADDRDAAVYFLSDYGMADEFVGVVHAVLHVRAPGVPVIDLGHQVPTYDVAAGAAMLVRCAPYLGAGVVLAVVDPGVGTDRRGVAVETAGTGPSWLVGPDNGLLVALADVLGGVERVVALRRPDGTVPDAEPAGRTFDGRDLFAPAAARLVLGARPAEVGTEVEPASLSPAAVAAPAQVVDPVVTGGHVPPHGPSGVLEGAVTWIDRFGNVQLGVDPGALDALGVDHGARALVTLPGPPRRSALARRVRAFGDLEVGELGLLADSSGWLAVVRCQASAADHLGAPGVGDTVRISSNRERGPLADEVVPP